MTPDKRLKEAMRAYREQCEKSRQKLDQAVIAFKLATALLGMVVIANMVL